LRLEQSLKTLPAFFDPGALLLPGAHNVVWEKQYDQNKDDAKGQQSASAEPIIQHQAKYLHDARPQDRTGQCTHATQDDHNEYIDGEDNANKARDEFIDSIS